MFIKLKTIISKNFFWFSYSISSERVIFFRKCWKRFCRFTWHIEIKSFFKKISRRQSNDWIMTIFQCQRVDKSSTCREIYYHFENEKFEKEIKFFENIIIIIKTISTRKLLKMKFEKNFFYKFYIKLNDFFVVDIIRLLIYNI